MRSGSSHQANLFAVANGQLDVATNNSTSLISTARAAGARPDEVRVIWQSPVLPEDPIIWRKDLDPAVKEKLRQFFLTYGQGNGPEAARARGYMAKINIGGFRPADDNHLLPVREMEATDLWLEAKKAATAAKIAAAKARARRDHRPARGARRRAPALRPRRSRHSDRGRRRAAAARRPWASAPSIC